MNGTRTCTIPDCGKPYEARGMCASHYSHWKYVTPPDERSRPTECERFDSKYTVGSQSECWEWKAGVTEDGYGRFNTSGGRRVIASRYALERAKGAAQQPEFRACHTCDNPPCVNPAHLYWGTEKQNSQDAVVRNRKSHGNSHPTSRLTAANVRSIRTRYAAGDFSTVLAREFGVSPASIREATSGANWKRAGGPITPVKKRSRNGKD
ncbi:hypothetical protein RCH22_000984 [Cryobacterium psychrotolerans]|nr:hypothetical protein [Cryobacterium psychrotolerans]MEC5149265.1 hypothetical protein [Cryobacterium psychrotolerans]MEC5149343.1 hypothetical protein [Cryobacterium psychrotolerans]